MNTCASCSDCRRERADCLASRSSRLFLSAAGSHRRGLSDRPGAAFGQRWIRPASGFRILNRKPGFLPAVALLFAQPSAFAFFVNFFPGNPRGRGRVPIAAEQGVAVGRFGAMGHAGIQSHHPSRVLQPQTGAQSPHAAVRKRIVLPIQATGPVLRPVQLDRHGLYGQADFVALPAIGGGAG